MLTVACVRVGTKYGRHYVDKLASMVERHLPLPHRFTCVGDAAAQGLTGWWAKMRLFDPALRGDGRWLYFDLDTAIVADLTPLAAWGGEFGIAANFTRAAEHPTWPCRFGSCVMSLAPGFGGDVWRAFDADRSGWMARCPKGDQQAVEALAPEAALLNDDLPPGYLAGWRDLGPDGPPAGAAVVCFGGSRSPANSPYRWVKEAWR